MSDAVVLMRGPAEGASSQGSAARGFPKDGPS